MKGFTLIELLVVIAIIVLLVSILVPSLKKAKELAHQAVCMSNMRSNANAANMYASEHQRFSPGGLYEPGGGLGYTKKGQWFHPDVLGNYIGLQTATGPWDAPDGTARCPSEPIMVTTPYVGYNGSMCSTAHGELRDREGVGNGETDSFGYTRVLPCVLGPAFQDISIATDCIVLFQDSREQGFLYVTKYKMYYKSTDAFYPEAGISESSNNQPDFRHGEGANYGFMDGHAAHFADVEETVDALMAGKITQFYK